MQDHLGYLAKQKPLTFWQRVFQTFNRIMENKL